MMKKVLYLRLLFAIFASMVSLPMFAYDIAVKNADGVTIYYNKWDNTLSVTYTGERDSGYGIYGNNYAGKVDIPFSVEYGGKIYSVTSIDMSAFYGCSGLTSVIIPNSVTYIGSYAFRGCSKLTSITLPPTLTSVDDGAFRDCYSLNAVYISDLETFFKIVFSIDFDSSDPLTSNPLKYAGHLFLNGEEIKDLEVPNSITKINNNACVGWYALNSLKIPNSVTSIGEHAFENCSGLTSVTIPSSVTSIDVFAFCGCSGLKTIVSEIENPFKIDRTVFSSDTNNAATLIVPKGTKALYQATEGWNQFTNIIEAGGVGYEFEVDGINYKVGEDNTVYVTYKNAGYSGDVVIPSSVTYQGNTYRVTSIDSAFYGCYGLTSITIPNSVTSIGLFAFYESGLTFITIPNSVTSIGFEAFMNCSSLTSVTIPNSVTSIDGGAFRYCSSLTSFVSEIENPFEIDESVFWGIPSDAQLIVPKGTKALYQATEGWNLFKNIVEDSTDEDNFTINGITYQGTKSSKTVVVKSVDKGLVSIEVPASVSDNGTDYKVTGIDNDAFKGSNMVALIWDVDVALPINAFSNASIGSNFLLYVKLSSFAPSSIKNVVVDGTASSIQLSDDGGQFYCPQAFTARTISYTHNYSMETGGNGKGWETIALPFDVQKIVHNTRGEIVPFAGYSSASNQKPFWLGNMSASGFKRASSIQANEPYIIAMPNNSKYNNDYNLAGDVTFSADNVQVAKTPTFNGLFLPAFATVAKSSSVYALNVNNRNVRYSGSYDAGSRFIANLRDVRPFEAYISNSSTRGIIEISFDDGATDMLDILLPTDENQELTIHTLSGQQVTRTSQRDFDAVWQQLPKGVYIINGKKWIK